MSTDDEVLEVQHEKAVDWTSLNPSLTLQNPRNLLKDVHLS